MELDRRLSILESTDNILSRLNWPKYSVFSIADARKLVRENLSVLQNVPYHSKEYGLSENRRSKLTSPKLAEAYLHEVLVPRAKKGDCLVVVTRGSKLWNIKESENIIIYKRAETRSASLGENSRGGNAILKYLSTAA